MIIHGVDVQHHDFSNAVTIELDLERDICATLDEIERLCIKHGYTLDDFFASLLEASIDKFDSHQFIAPGHTDVPNKDIFDIIAEEKNRAKTKAHCERLNEHDKGDAIWAENKS